MRMPRRAYVGRADRHRWRLPRRASGHPLRGVPLEIRVRAMATAMVAVGKDDPKLVVLPRHDFSVCNSEQMPKCDRVTIAGDRAT